MATIKYRLSLEYENTTDGTAWEENFGEKTITVSGNNYLENIQNVGITEEPVILGDVTVAGGFSLWENLDTVNYVELRLPGTGAGNDSVKILPGEAYPVRLGSDVVTPCLIANTAPCRVRYRIWPA